MSYDGILTGVAIAHDSATIDQLEAASVADERETIAQLLESDGVSEAFILQTCNRVEAYVVTDRPEQGTAALGQIGSTVPEARHEMGHEESLRHLLRVGAGLESLVIGEDQILGQVRDAYETAREADGIGPILENGITKAIRVGERARTETAINEGVVSLASAAVRLVAERHGLVGTTAAVIGTGEMGTLAAKRLAPRVDELVLANRTVDNAERIAAQIETENVETASLEDLEAILSRAAVVITATASENHVVSLETLASAGQTFIVDITRPRDVPVEAEDIDQVTVYDLDRLEGVTEKTRQMRTDATAQVEEIVDEEFDRLLTQYKRQQADHVISAMYEGAERIKAGEVERTIASLDLDEEERAAVESMADAIVSGLLAAPTESLRDAAQADDWETIHTALQLFDPRFDPADDISTEGIPGDLDIPSGPMGQSDIGSEQGESDREPAYEQSDD